MAAVAAAAEAEEHAKSAETTEGHATTTAKTTQRQRFRCSACAGAVRFESAPSFAASPTIAAAVAATWRISEAAAAAKMMTTKTR